MARTAPVPNIPAIPGMNPGVFIMGGGGGGGGRGGRGGRGGKNKQGANGKNGGNNANGGGKGAGGCGRGSSGCPGPHGGTGTKAGHPVDLATGEVLTVPVLDLFLPGPMPLELWREYRSSASERDVGLGPGWSHTFAWSIEVRRRTLTLWKGDGASVELDLPEIGGSVPMNDGWLLTRTAGGFRVVDEDSITWVLEQVPGREGTFRLAGLEDRNGNTIALVYEHGRLVFLVDSAGRLVRVRYGHHGRIAAFEVKNALQQGVWISFYAYAYSEQGDLVAVTDAEGNVTTFAYDEHRLTMEQRPGGLRAVFIYDDAGRCIETFCDRRGEPDPSLDDDVPELLADNKTKAKGFLHCKIDYGDDGYVEVTDSRQVRRLETNAFGKVDKGTLGAAVFSHTYDEAGLETSYTDPLGATTRYVRDEHGRVTAIVDPLGRHTHYDYDAEGEIAAITTPDGCTVTYRYDEAGNLLEARDPLGMIVGFEYDHRGLIERVLFPNGGVAHLRHDAWGNRVEVVEPDGATKRIDYDFLGRVVRFVDARGAETRYAYDARGNLAATFHPNGGVQRCSYDADGRPTRTTNEDGRPAELVWAGNNVVIEIREAGGGTVRARYDREGQLVRLVNEKGESHQFTRNAAGLVVQERTFDGRVLTYRNDLVGRIVEIESDLREKTELVYDAAGQLIEQRFADDTVISYEYDELGHVIGAITGGVEYRCAFDMRGRRTNERIAVDGRSFEVKSDFDTMNARVRRASSLGFIERITRDIRSRPASVLLDGRSELRSTWDPGGLEVARRLPGGAWIQSAFNATKEVVRRSVVVPGPPVPPGVPAYLPRTTVDKAYRYNLAGELLEEHDQLWGRTRYELDPIGQLKARVPQAGMPEMFTYDADQTLYEAAPGASRRDYAPGGRCVRARGAMYVHDRDGRLVEKRVPKAGGEDVWRYTWSAKGLLRSVERPDGAVVEFGYDGFDRRVVKRLRPAGRGAPPVTTYFVWDGVRLLHEITERARAAGDPIVEERTYVFSEETLEPIGHRDVVIDGGSRREGDWVFYVTNQVDAPEHLVSPEGERLASIDLSAFGEARLSEGAKADTPLRFRGQYADAETGLYYNFCRYYDPELAQYISPDPIGVEGGIRLFGYVGNRPRTLTDPFGLADPLTTTVTLSDDTQVVGHSKGYHTKNKTQGTYSGGAGTLPPGFPEQLPGKNTKKNECGECEALNKLFEGLDPENPAHHKRIKEQAKKIKEITPRRDKDGKVLPPCEYCTQRLARLSEVSGVNLFNKVTPPGAPKKNPFTNIRGKNKKQDVANGAGGSFPYTLKQPGNQIWPNGAEEPLSFEGDPSPPPPRKRRKKA
ncbi:RHS repeat-associated core domain-containing protein [Sorangium sp. So ce513]|uniref:RHS repeat-associated core domain-containing protein n=1 Tax=Sorangium sp. So ce513 TaxID=3133315 RepID=UPI003F629D89